MIKRAITGLFAALLAASAHAAPAVDIVEIPLDGLAAKASREFSGLAWYEDHLILLPQYPDWAGKTIFKIPQQEILDLLAERRSGPITPGTIKWNTPKSLKRRTAEYEGFEAVVLQNGQVLATIESKAAPYRGFLVGGVIGPKLKKVNLNPTPSAPMPSPSCRANRAEEALILLDGQAFAIHEENGPHAVANPVARRFGVGLEPLAPGAPFPPLPFRVTDATAADAQGRFWVTHVHDPAHQQQVAGECPKRPAAALPDHPVEEVVEIRWTGKAFETTGRRIALTPSAEGPRNWEGLARLPGKGLLLITDQRPRTLLGFIPLAE